MKYSSIAQAHDFLSQISMLNFLLSIILIVGLLETSGQEAFCRKENNENVPRSRFPLEPPQRHIPWIWDAVLSHDGSYVEATAISRNACKFNVTRWKRISNKYPQYTEQFGGGLDSSILVPFDINYDYARGTRTNPGLMDKHVVCAFIKNGEVVSRITSRRIEDEDSAEMSTMQIRCPVPYKKEWTHLRLERKLTQGDYIDRVRQNYTDMFPVCRMKSYHNNNNNIAATTDFANKSPYPPFQASRDHKLPLGKHTATGQYSLAVCTATSRSVREELVEWIEYHKLMGVDHFYIYNTAIEYNQQQLPNTIKDYIRNGSVTVVSWPYSNCVDGMGAGRWVHYLDNGDSTFFQPPRAIAQTAALASCYSRYRSTTKWMAHIDDDEFLAINFGKSFGGRRVKTLVELVERISEMNPSTRAVYFKPLNIVECPGDSSVRKASKVLPRFGRWQTARAGVDWEGKMIMRSEAVGMFFVHYMTLRESGNWDREARELSHQEGAVLHYKTPPEVSGNIFGGYLPLDVQGIPKDCHYRDSKIAMNGTVFRRKMTSLIIPYVEINYQMHVDPY
eukprot:gene2579-5041_t